MRIEIHTTNPQQLWNNILEAIEATDIKTWEVVPGLNDAQYLTHTPPQWNLRALLKHSIAAQPNRLILTVTYFNDRTAPDNDVKGYYVGRFTEQLMVHFTDQLTKLEVFP